MNKLAIFDLDGVLCSIQSVHFDTLNCALAEYGHAQISLEDHLRRFDGLPTHAKLTILGITGSEALAIQKFKQEETMKLLQDDVEPDKELAELLHDVYAKGYLLAVVSNAKRATVDKCLELMSLQYLFSWAITPDLPNGMPSKLSPKPAPDMYLDVMLKAGAGPLSTVIFEDAPAGLEGAHASGALVVQVNGKLEREVVMAALDAERKPHVYQWEDLNVLMPAAGRGQRFADAGYEDPKPFIEVNEKPMAIASLDSLMVGGSLPTFVVLEEYEHEKCLLDRGIVYGLVDRTRGTAETCLVANLYEEFVDKPLLIANCDQILEWNHLAFYHFCRHTTLDGVIVVFDEPNRDPKWSYCQISNGLVCQVAEKIVISQTACTGVWFWKHGSDFVKYAEQMIAADKRVNGEFYVSQVYDQAICDGLKVGTFRVDKFHSLGTPEDLKKYLERKK